MTDLTQPIGYIKPQAQANVPITSDNTLVNDPVALVNDNKALVGGQSTQIGVLGTSASSNSPSGFIKQSH